MKLFFPLIIFIFGSLPAYTISNVLPVSGIRLSMLAYRFYVTTVITADSVMIKMTKGHP